jgi:hypothetical protein
MELRGIATTYKKTEAERDFRNAANVSVNLTTQEQDTFPVNFELLIG